MSRLVSVLMPAYNAERWIVSAIESVLEQTWRNVELIVVDDGSRDGTLAAARSVRSARVKVLTQANAGPCAARNTALPHAQGDMIQWLDADDLLAPDKIERQMQRFEQQGGNESVLLAGSWGTFTDRPEDARFAPTSVWTDLAPRELLMRKFIDNAHIVLHAWLIPRALVEAAGPWDLRLQRTDADGEYSSRLVRHSRGVLFVSESRCYYRKGIAGSLSATRRYLDEEELLLRLLFSNLLEIEDSEQTRQACVHWLQLWASNYYILDRRTPEIAQRVAEFLGQNGVQLRLPLRTRAAHAVLGWNGAHRLKLAALRARAALQRLVAKLHPVA